MKMVINFIKKNWFVFLGVIAVFIIVKSCEPKPKITTETKIVYVPKVETITETIIKKVDKPVYIERTKTIKGKDTIIYRDSPTDATIIAKQYDAELKANKSIARLKITALGEVLDVQGTIEYNQKETTTTITKIVPMSGLFVYGETSFLPVLERVEIGLDYQIRNTIIIGVSASHNLNYNATYFNAKIGIRLF